MKQGRSQCGPWSISVVSRGISDERSQQQGHVIAPLMIETTQLDCRKGPVLQPALHRTRLRRWRKRCKRLDTALFLSPPLRTGFLASATAVAPCCLGERVGLHKNLSGQTELLAQSLNHRQSQGSFPVKNF